VEEKTEATWKKRKEELVIQGVATGTETTSSLMQWLTRIVAAGTVVVVVWLGIQLNRSTPGSEAGSANSRVSDTATDVEMNFQTASGDIKVRASELKSIKPNFEQGNVEV